MDEKHRQISIFPKIVLMFLAVILPLYVLGFQMNQRGEASVRQEIISSLQARVQFYNETLEREIERMLQLQIQYVSDQNLTDLSLNLPILTEHNRTLAIDSLYSKIQLLQSSSAYIESVSIHIPMLERTISTKGYVDSIPVDKFSMLKSASARNHNPLIYWHDGLYVKTVYPERLYSGDKEPQFILEAELSMRAIRQSLSRIVNNQRGGAWLLNSEWALASDMEPKLYKEMQQYHSKQSVETHSGEIDSIIFQSQKYLAVYQNSKMLGTTLALYVPEADALGPLLTYQRMYLLLLFVSVGVVIIFSFWIYRYIHRPIVKLLRVFRQVEEGDLGVNISHNSRDEFHHLYVQFNNMVRKLKALIAELYEQKLLTQRAELKQLQSNIHPHFLYNTFYTVYRMSQSNDMDSIRQITKHLGDYFRYINRNAGDEVPLQKEVEHSRNYVEIQAFRFGNRISVEFEEVPERYAGIMVPKLILQPILENAFNHGLESRGVSGKLRIGFQAEGRLMIISVDDNGKMKSTTDLQELQTLLETHDQGGEATGMINVHRRLLLKYGSAGGLTISQNEWGGLCVRLMLLIEK